MPPLERTDLLQSAVFWYPKTVDGYAQPVLGVPVQLDVRWVDKQTRMLDPKGNTIAVDATAIVDDNIEQFAPAGVPPWKFVVGGMMWLGALSDLGAPAIPLASLVPTSVIMEIKAYAVTPDIKGGRESRRRVGLMFYHDQLPPVVP